MNKFIIMVAVAFTAMWANAEEDFAARKAKALEKIDGRIAKMQGNRQCVAAAADMSALKECRKEMKRMRKEMRGEQD